MKTCRDRHIIRKDLDQPLEGMPKSGVVRILITAVRDTTCYYARILKFWDENRKMVDLSGVSFQLAEKMRNFFKTERTPINGKQIKIGNLYGRRTAEGLYQRVRVEDIMERDFLVCNCLFIKSIFIGDEKDIAGHSNP